MGGLEGRGELGDPGGRREVWGVYRVSGAPLHVSGTLKEISILETYSETTQSPPLRTTPPTSFHIQHTISSLFILQKLQTSIRYPYFLPPNFPPPARTLPPSPSNLDLHVWRSLCASIYILVKTYSIQYDDLCYYLYLQYRNMISLCNLRSIYIAACTRHSIL